MFVLYTQKVFRGSSTDVWNGGADFFLSAHSGSGKAGKSSLIANATLKNPVGKLPVCIRLVIVKAKRVQLVHLVLIAAFAQLRGLL